MTHGFEGFPPEAFDFFEGLEADNSKTYFDAHRAVYVDAVRAPLQTLVDGVPERHRPFHLFRMNRDLRFTPDKSPYKTAQGAVGAGGEYVQVSAAGLLAAVGLYEMRRDQLDRFRRAVADEVTGPKLVEILARLRRDLRVGDLGGASLKTAPRGYPKDHPRIDLLRMKGLVASVEISDPDVLHGPAARGEVVAVWRTARPLTEWLDRHVGPTTEDSRGR